LRLAETARGTIGNQIQIETPDYIGSKTFEPTRQQGIRLVWAAVLFLLLATARRLLHPYSK
jgi:hypothetical protein